jgi:hypothetical protein
MFTDATKKSGKIFDELISFPQTNQGAFNTERLKEKGKTSTINFNLRSSADVLPDKSFL